MELGVVMIVIGVLLMCLTLFISNRDLKARVHKLDRKVSEHFNCHHRQVYDRLPDYEDQGPAMWIDKYQPWPTRSIRNDDTARDKAGTSYRASA